MKPVVLFSGGLDSLLATFYLENKYGYFPDLFYVSGKCKYSFSEKSTVFNVLKPIFETSFNPVPSFIDGDISSYAEYIFNFSKIEDFKTAEIPFRNLFFILYAVILKYDEICLIVQKGEQEITDRSTKFFKLTEEYLSSITNRDIKINPVFNDYTKVEALKWFINDYNKIDYATKIRLVTKVYSCYEDNTFTPHERCGRCSACIRLFVAFYLNNLTPDFKYRNKPTDTPLWEEYIRRALSDEIQSDRGAELLLCDKLVRENKHAAG